MVLLVSKAVCMAKVFSNLAEKSMWRGHKKLHTVYIPSFHSIYFFLNEDKAFVSTALHSKPNGKYRGCSIQLTLLEIEKNFE